MRSSILAVAAGAVLTNGLAVRNDCTMHIDADGAISGHLGVLKSGQVKGGNVGLAVFHINGGKIWDDFNRGCWWTPPTHTLQCDTNQAPDEGWEVACDGTLSYKGQTTFYECESSNGQYNFYLEDGQGINCGKVGFKSDGCHADCTPPPPENCPTDLSGTYEFPHLIIPVDKDQADTAKGTSYNGLISSTVSSIFNFDIPAADSGKKCSLVFLFPTQDQLETSSFTFSGDGKLDFYHTSEPANEQTTWNNQPGSKTDYGVTTVSPGHSYAIATFDCPAGQTVGFGIKEAGSTYLEYFQDYNPSPIGLYITVC